jgi:hypothetical protein
MNNLLNLVIIATISASTCSAQTAVEVRIITDEADAVLFILILTRIGLTSQRLYATGWLLRPLVG